MLYEIKWNIFVIFQIVVMIVLSKGVQHFYLHLLLPQLCSELVRSNAKQNQSVKI